LKDFRSPPQRFGLSGDVSAFPMFVELAGRECLIVN